MVIGLLTLDLHFPGARSLKDKRQALRSLETRLRNKFNVAVAEVEHQDLWQRARLAVVSVNTDHGHLESTLQQRRPREAEHARDIQVLDAQTEILTERAADGAAGRGRSARRWRGIVARGLKDPRIGFVTITRVDAHPRPAPGPRLLRRAGRRGAARQDPGRPAPGRRLHAARAGQAAAACATRPS